MHRSQQLPQPKQMEMEDVDMIDENEIERILSRSAYNRKKFDIFEAPEFIQRLNAYREAMVGDTVTFSGQYRALPKPTVKWFKDEEEILETVRHQLDLSSEMEGIVRLIITDIRRKDEGAYKCKVENQEGVASTTGYLSVTGKSSDKTSNNLQARKATSDRVSTPPYLRPIAEQKSMEEREEKEYQRLPPSPLQEFIDSIRHCAKSMQGAIDYGALDCLDDMERFLEVEDEDVFSDGDISKSPGNLDLDLESSEDDELLTESDNSSDQDSGDSSYHKYSDDIRPEVRVCAVDSFVSPSVDLTLSKSRDKKPTSGVDILRLSFEGQENSVSPENFRQNASLFNRRNKLVLQRSQAIELTDFEHSTITLRLNADISKNDDVANTDISASVDVIDFEDVTDNLEEDEEVKSSVVSTFSQEHKTHHESKWAPDTQKQVTYSDAQKQVTHGNTPKQVTYSDAQKQVTHGNTQKQVTCNSNYKDNFQNLSTKENTESEAKTYINVCDDEANHDVIIPSLTSLESSDVNFIDIFPNLQRDLVDWLDEGYAQFYLLLCVLGTALALIGEIPPGRLIPIVGVISIICFTRIFDKVLELFKRKL